MVLKFTLVNIFVTVAISLRSKCRLNRLLRKKEAVSVVCIKFISTLFNKANLIGGKYLKTPKPYIVL